MIDPKNGLINTKKTKHHFEDKTVVILKGEFKGQRGQCIQVTETGAWILTKAKSKIVTVPVADVELDSETKTDTTQDHWGGQTPAYGGNSPSFMGYQTPAPGYSQYDSTH